MTKGIAIPQEKSQKVNKLRYAEYYDQQPLHDELYAKSKAGESFPKLMRYIISDDNILLAYRSMKSNSGSNTPGTDNLTIKDIESLTPEEVCYEVIRRLRDYHPKAVRRKDIPKPNGKTRPLGIPCIWDRLIQQCIFQILDPICEAKFSESSYGFRPQRSAKHAIAHAMRLANQSKLHFVVEVDIKGFFDHVNHPKLMRQLWTMGIRDKQLLCVIKSILKAPIKMPDGRIVTPTEGTPQGGILSPLLANVVLNELDLWVESQWEEMPVVYKYGHRLNKSGGMMKSDGYAALKRTNLKEMHIVRYADDFRIFCRTREEALKTMHAVKAYLEERLKLEVSEEKTRVVNMRKQRSEFLGIKMMVSRKGHKYVVQSNVCDKALKRTAIDLKRQIGLIRRPPNGTTRTDQIIKYNAMVRGKHNYYDMATRVNMDFEKIGWPLVITMNNRLKDLRKKGVMGRKSMDYKRYGPSKLLRYLEGMYILPVAYVRHKNPMCKQRVVNVYTPEGRKPIHDNLAFSNKWILQWMASHPVPNRSAQYNDNRVSLFAEQYGKCAVLEKAFITPDEVHAHHIKPTSMGGDDSYRNLVIVRDDVHILIHATNPETISKYLDNLNLTSQQMKKLNNLREKAGREPV